MKLLQLAVCDDEPYMRREISVKLSQYLENAGQDFQITCFSQGRELLECSRSFDLIFLDIQMGEPDGMKTAQLLRQQGFRGLLVFVTVLRDNVFDAFGVSAFDYLVKPLEDNRLSQTLERALKVLKGRSCQTITIRRGNAYQIIDLNHVIYFEVMGRKIYIHMNENKVVDYYCRLEDLEGTVGHRFFRCHRSYLVNLDYVSGMRGGTIALMGGGTIPVSRLREQELARSLLFHMRERRR